MLVVDQFEEVFTLTTDERERELFLEALRVAAADPESRLRIIVTLRADFYDRPLTYPRFGELLAERTEAVPPLTPDELEQAIRGPAERVGARLETGLVAGMIADVAHQPGALPLLQYALTELFERRDEDRLTLAAYQELGGVAGALSARAERIYEAADQRGRRATNRSSCGWSPSARAGRTRVAAWPGASWTPSRWNGMPSTSSWTPSGATGSSPSIESLPPGTDGGDRHEALLSAWERLRT